MTPWIRVEPRGELVDLFVGAVIVTGSRGDVAATLGQVLARLHKQVGSGPRTRG